MGDQSVDEAGVRISTEEALRASEEKYRRIVEATHGGIWMIDVESRTTFANRRLAEMLGYTSDEILGRPLSSFVTDEARADAERNVERWVKGIAEEQDVCLRRKDGSGVWTILGTTPLFGPDGTCAGALLAVTDISRRKVVDDSLKVKEAAIRSSISGIAMSDLAARVTYVNDAFVRMWKLDSADEALGRSISTFVLDPTTEASSVDAAKARGQWIGEFTARRKDGSTFQVQLVANRVDDEKGRPICLLASFLDVSDRRQTEEMLRESEERFRLLADAAAEGVLIADGERIVDCNEQFSRMFGYSTAEMIGMSYSDFTTTESLDQIRKRRLAGKAGRQRLTGRRRDGSTFPAEASTRVVRYRGKTLRVSAVQDLTEQRRAQEEIWKLNEDLERRVLARTEELEVANRELEAFSYSVSHDLRAPLRAIEGFSGLLAKDSGDRLTAEDQRLLEVVRENARRMSGLIDDLLTLSRSGRHEMRRDTLGMKSIVLSAIEEVAVGPEPRAEIDLKLDALPDAEGDPTLIRQVWINLLSNALKFSARKEKPVIEVGGALDGELAVYRVADNGVGFDMKYVEKLFGVFQRLHGPRDFQGTGVGLALVKRIVERHGGRVWAEGEVEKGATFYFALPVRKEPDSAATPGQASREETA